MKYYLDTSSIVKIYHPEEGSKESLKLYQGSSTLCISELSVLEFISVVYRKLRENDIDSKTAGELVLKFREDIETRYELLNFSPLVFEEASQVLEIYGKSHALRTLESIQFAFFLIYCEKDDVFVCSDKRLTSVVSLDGHRVMFPTGLLFSDTDHKERKGSKTLFLSPPHMGGEELAFVKKAFKSNYIAPLGPMVDGFEKEFAEKVGAKHAVALSSGTAALHLALQYCGVKPEDEVMTSTLTFIGSAGPITYLGAKPVFVDSDRASWNVDPGLLIDELESCADNGRLPKAVVLVHLYGQCADIAPILDACKRYGVVLIEDAAEALGATYNGRSAGTFGKAGIFSFNGNKILTTSGGGMLVSDDKDLVEKVKFLSQQARDPAPHYEHSEIGYNYRMSNVLAAIGRGQLRVLEQRVEGKREIFDYYSKKLQDVPGVDFMPEAAYGRSNRWLTCITVDPDRFGADREQVRLALEEENIEARPVWKPMHMQPVFDRSEPRAESREQKKNRKTYPCRVVGGEVAEDLFERGLCLPSGTAMTEGDLDKVIEVILNSRPK